MSNKNKYNKSYKNIIYQINHYYIKCLIKLINVKYIIHQINNVNKINLFMLLLANLSYYSFTLIIIHLFNINLFIYS